MEHKTNCECWLKCCFTSTETVGLSGTGAQDVHLDFHTAPGLCCECSANMPFSKQWGGEIFDTKEIFLHENNGKLEEILFCALYNSRTCRSSRIPSYNRYRNGPLLRTPTHTVPNNHCTDRSQSKSYFSDWQPSAVQLTRPVKARHVASPLRSG